MKRLLQITTACMLMAALAVFTMPAQAQDYGTGKTTTVGQVDPADLTMDGEATEAAWADARTIIPTENWATYGGVDNPDIGVEAKLLWAEDTLYVHMFSQDNDTLFFGVPGEPWQGDQFLIGVDGTHSMDTLTDDTFAGWPDQAPDSLTVYKVTVEDQGGITLNWGYDGIFPEEEGWVNGEVLTDSASYQWQVEAAIYVPQIEEGAQIGFNIGGAAGDEDFFVQEDSADGAYSYFSWSMHPEGDPGFAIQHRSRNYGTLSFQMSVGVDEIAGSAIPDEFALRANYPNPFRSSTTIAYDMAKPGHVSIGVYDVLGRKVTSLVDDTRAANTYKVRWSPESHLANGIYFYQLRVDDELIATRRVTLLR